MANNYVLKPGPPEDLKNRSPKEQSYHDFLLSCQVSYDYVDHEEVVTMEDVKEMDEFLEIPLCKNLFLHNKKKDAHYLLLMPGEKRVDLKGLAEEIGSTRLSFAGPEELLELMDLEQGYVSPLGLKNDTEKRVTFLLDQELNDLDYFVLMPGSLTTSIRIKKEDFLSKVLPKTNHELVMVSITE